MHTQAHALAVLRLEDTGGPIYVQLREQFLRAMGAGLLSPGDQMPTMRQVAVALKVDLNTVRHAYDELERLGARVPGRRRGGAGGRSHGARSTHRGAGRRQGESPMSMPGYPMTMPGLRARGGNPTAALIAVVLFGFAGLAAEEGVRQGNPAFFWLTALLL